MTQFLPFRVVPPAVPSVLLGQFRRTTGARIPSPVQRCGGNCKHVGMIEMPHQRVQETGRQPQVIIEQDDDLLGQFGKQPIVGEEVIVCRGQSDVNFRVPRTDPIAVALRTLIIEDQGTARARIRVHRIANGWQQAFEMADAVVVQDGEANGLHKSGTLLRCAATRNGQVLSDESARFVVKQREVFADLLEGPVPPADLEKGLDLVCLQPVFDDSRRNAANQRIGRHVAGHNRAGGDDGAIANSNAREDHCIDADPHVISHFDTALGPSVCVRKVAETDRSQGKSRDTVQTVFPEDKRTPSAMLQNFPMTTRSSGW